MSGSKERFPKLFKYEDRLVRFAGEIYYFSKSLKNDFATEYYTRQLIRSSGSPVLNFGEAQAAISDRDFKHKMSIVVKELKESRGCMKILSYIEIGDQDDLMELLKECEELIAIGSKMIINKST